MREIEYLNERKQDINRAEIIIKIINIFLKKATKVSGESKILEERNKRTNERNQIIDRE